VARGMSDDHKAALAKGRTQGRAVRDYLAVLDRERKPGRKVDRATLEKRIEDLRTQAESEPEPSKRLELIQRRLDAEDRLATLEEEPDVDAVEAAFVEAAAEYSERRGISYTAWRETGVPAAVLQRAGIKRTRRTT
jgi:hypothetical protein